jgi:two-component system LytT family response regulator
MNINGLNILLIDTESSSVNHLRELLEIYPLISNIDNVPDFDLALLKIIHRSPDIVFIEYPLHGIGGNEFIKFIKTKLPETIIVFVSDSKMHAAAAIRSGIFNFLLKPIGQSDFENVMNKILLIKKISNKEKINQIIEETPKDIRLRLQTTRGYLLINPEEIIYCKADGVYTEMFFINKRVELSYLFLSKVEEILKPYNFIKVSRSFIINMRFLRKIFRDNNTVILSVNGKEYEIKGSKQSIRILSKIETE